MERIGRIDPAVLEFPRPVVKIANVTGLQVMPLPKRVASITHGCVFGKYILVAPNRRTWERRLTIAHEIGHVVLGSYSGEAECNAFAASLIIPRNDLIKQIKRFDEAPPFSVSQLASAEEEKAMMSRLVKRYCLGYHALLVALADNSMIEGVPPWMGHIYRKRLASLYFNSWRAYQHSG